MREGIRLFKGGKYEKALEALLKVEVPPEQYPEQAYYLGLSYAKLEQFDEALLYLEQVAASDLDFARIFQGRLIIGYIYAVTERYRLAEFEFNQLLEDGYESPKVYAALAFVLFKQDKTAQSISQLEKALELDPDNPNALNSLGFILADKEIRVGVALQYCRRAYDQNPHNPAYQDSLGWAQFKCGNIREAVRYLSMARKQLPGDPELERHWSVVSRAAEKV